MLAIYRLQITIYKTEMPPLSTLLNGGTKKEKTAEITLFQLFTLSLFLIKIFLKKNT